MSKLYCHVNFSECCGIFTIEDDDQRECNECGLILPYHILELIENLQTENYSLRVCENCKWWKCTEGDWYCHHSLDCEGYSLWKRRNLNE